MKAKKTEKADIDKKSGLYFRIGLSIALLVTIGAFQWTVYDREVVSLESGLVLDEEEEIIDITKQENIAPPPPVAPPELQIVEDDVEITSDQPTLEDQDVNEQTAITLTDISDKKEEVIEEEIFLVVEETPSFPGGDAARNNFLNANLRYPDIERENGIQGLVVVSFVVEKDGSLSNVSILKGVTPNLNEEAIRVVKSMPRWNPGKQRGKAVRVSVNLPIRFILN